METASLLKTGKIIWKCPSCDKAHEDFFSFRNNSIVFECISCKNVFIQESRKDELKLISDDNIKTTNYFFWICTDCNWINNTFKPSDEMTCQKCETKFKLEYEND